MKDSDMKMAKKEVLQMLKKMMMDDGAGPLKGKLDGMKKVTVMSDSEEGLEEGLSKAEQILKKRKEMFGEESKSKESSEESEEESEDEEEMDEYSCGGIEEDKKKKMKY